MARQHQDAAGRHELQGGMRGGHPTGVRECRAALQRADGLLQCRPGRVAVPAVAHLALTGWIGAHIRGGEDDRGIEGCVDLGRWPAGMDGDGGGVQARPGVHHEGKSANTRAPDQAEVGRRVGSHAMNAAPLPESME